MQHRILRPEGFAEPRPRPHLRAAAQPFTHPPASSVPAIISHVLAAPTSLGEVVLVHYARLVCHPLLCLIDALELPFFTPYCISDFPQPPLLASRLERNTATIGGPNHSINFASRFVLF